MSCYSVNCMVRSADLLWNIAFISLPLLNVCRKNRGPSPPVYSHYFPKRYRPRGIDNSNKNIYISHDRELSIEGRMTLPEASKLYHISKGIKSKLRDY